MTPLIAQRRRDDALQVIEKKLQVADQLLADGNLDHLPKQASISSFCKWKLLETGVLPISRSVVYSKDGEYPLLRKKLENLLGRIRAARKRKNRKKDLESNLGHRLEMAEQRAASYLNQYNTVALELRDAKMEIERLNLKLSRIVAKTNRVSPIGKRYSSEIQSHDTQKDGE